jgi:hypothetical protein
MGARLELALAAIGTVTVLLVVIVGGVLTFCVLRDRLAYGQWWWDEAVDGLESGQ